jgi:hypothetical protein
MAFQFSAAARNAALDAIESAIGPAPTLTLLSGPVPADCEAVDEGVVLASVPCPPDWLAPAAAGQKVLAGTWQDLSADAAGVAAHFRIVQGAICHVQGTVTATNGGGDMTLDNVSLATGQQVTITAFTLTAGGA